ncbi:hypothetical protein VUR80DRAFT_2179 [Thermomyces stellatus]
MRLKLVLSGKVGSTSFICRRWSTLLRGRQWGLPASSHVGWYGGTLERPEWESCISKPTPLRGGGADGAWGTRWSTLRFGAAIINSGPTNRAPILRFSWQSRAFWRNGPPHFRGRPFASPYFRPVLGRQPIVIVVEPFHPRKPLVIFERNRIQQHEWEGMEPWMDKGMPVVACLYRGACVAQPARIQKRQPEPCGREHRILQTLSWMPDCERSPTPTLAGGGASGKPRAPRNFVAFQLQCGVSQSGTRSVAEWIRRCR